MASFLDKIKVRTAIDNRTKLDLGHDHLTTQDWMEFLPVYNREMVPKEKLDVMMSTTVRMQPLVRPTFGRANINNRCFFVPYETIFPAWNDFITDTPHVSYTNSTSTVPYGLVSKVPTFTLDTWTNFILDPNNGYFTTSQGTPGSYDFVTWNQNSSGSASYYAYTPKGRRIIKFMKSLGYVIPIDTDPSSASWHNEEYSALPLLAAAKIYMDWYFPSAYAETTYFIQVDQYFKYDVNGWQLLPADLKTIIETIEFVNYDSDYFVSAWDNPTAPNNGLFGGVGIPTPETFSIRSMGSSAGTAFDANPQVRNAQIGSTTSDHARQGSNDGTPFIETGVGASGSTAAVNPISQFMLTALKSLTDYMKRHQLVGSRALDRYLARFGVNLSSESMRRSIYLGTNKIGIQFGDVTSHADTVSQSMDGAALGDYAGKGYAYGEGHFTYETDKYGQFMIISSIVPAAGYYQGCDRNVKHVSKLDFFTPEFDNLGTQMMTKDEVLVNYLAPQGGANSSGASVMTNTGFGFQPRYAECKIARDKVTGDWTIPTVSAGEDSWYLMRDLTNISGWTSASAVKHSLDFCRGIDKTQYNRIFQNGFLTSSAPDYFKCIYHFEIASYAPMAPLYDSYEFDGGKEITEDVNGVKMN